MRKIGIGVGIRSGSRNDVAASVQSLRPPRSLFRRPGVILDEPTSALGVATSMVLTISSNSVNGHQDPFSSTTTYHALAVGDRFTVLNHGQTIGTYGRGAIEMDELQKLMAGGRTWKELSLELRA
jgi:simple sugar transport system ATP-binding protein